MFVVATDFDLGPYSIPNLASNNSFAPYVAKKEEKALRDLLGNVLYDEFIVGLAALPAVFNPATDYAIDAQVYYGLSIWKSLVNPNVGVIPVEGVNWTLVEKNKWLMLRDGDTYSTSRRWVGLKTLLIPYIFSYWVGDRYEINTGIGVVKTKGENSVTVTPKRKIVRAWNDFADMAGVRLVGMLRRYDDINTLYGFLTANSDLYPDLLYCAPNTMNVLGI